MPDSDDVKAGRVPPRVCENGAIVPPRAQINSMTLREHMEDIARNGQRPLSPDEIAKFHPSPPSRLFLGN